MSDRLLTSLGWLEVAQTRSGLGGFAPDRGLGGIATDDDEDEVNGGVEMVRFGWISTSIGVGRGGAGDADGGGTSELLPVEGWWPSVIIMMEASSLFVSLVFALC